MDGKQLKNSILQWAIQGKLVPQNPKDEPAQKLLERIAQSRHSERSEESSKGSKKASLRGAKTMKQSKALSSRIYRENGVWYEQVGSAAPKNISDEIPFEIPENWAWCRLEHVCRDIADIDHKMPPVCENGVPYISPLNFKPNDEIDYDGAKKISVDDFKQLSRKCKPERGDIIFPRYGTIGVIRTVKTDIDFLVSYSCATIKPYKEYMDVGYICFLLQSSLIQKIEIPRYINKTTQPNVGLQSIKKFLFALPPLAEQKRIVAKLEQVLPLAEEYGAAQEQLDKLNKELPEALKKSILQEAIQGKLVPQNPKDEPAQKLLERIERDRNAKIKSGEIKLTKPEKNIKKKSPEYDIPQGWCWCQLVDICRAFGRIGFRGYTKEDLVTDSTKGALSISPSNMKDHGMEYNVCTYISWEKYEESPEIKIENGDLLIVKTGSSYGKAVLVENLPCKATINPQIAVIKDVCIEKKYLLYFLQSPFAREKYEDFVLGTSIPTFSQANLLSIGIPLPPLAEQKRIVKKIEELYKVVDSWH